MTTTRRRTARPAPKTSSLILIVGLGGLLFGVLGTAAFLLLGRDDTSEPSLEVMVTPGDEVARLETQVAQRPSDVGSMTVLAEVLANSGRVAESIEWFERALALEPNSVELRLAFAQALVRGGAEFDAQLQFEQAAELAPNQALPAFYLGQFHENRRQPRLDEARLWYQRAIEREPGSVAAQQAAMRLQELGSATPVSTAVD